MSLDDSDTSILVSGQLKLWKKSSGWKKYYCIATEDHIRLSKSSAKDRRWVKSIIIRHLDQLKLKGHNTFTFKVFKKEYKFRGDPEVVSHWFQVLSDVTMVPHQNASLGKKKSLLASVDNVRSHSVLGRGGVRANANNKINGRAIRPLVDKKRGSNKNTNKAAVKAGVGLDDFEIIKIVGIGSFGTVYLCKFLREEFSSGSKSPRDKVYAMKVLNKEDIRVKGKIERTKTELLVLKTLNHPFLITLHYAFHTKEKLYLITDFINGGELFFHLERSGRFSEERARFYAAEMSLGLDYLHSNNIIYRDLKPENVLIDSTGHIIMTDFGLSKELGPNDTTTSLCGTPEYLAPEIVSGKPYNSAVDWWALGMILYEMITGNPPFDEESINLLYDEIVHDDIIYPLSMSKAARSVISALAEKDTNLRISSLQQIKEHEFFAGIEWDKLLRREVTPPFLPQLKNSYDLANIDSEYLELSLESFNDANSFASDTFEDFEFNPSRGRHYTY